MSYGYRPQLCSFGRQRPSLYTDISVSQEMAKTDYPKFARTIREVVDAFGPERVLFGTDGPYTWRVLSDKDFVTAIKDLATKAPDDAKFTRNEIEMLLGDEREKTAQYLKLLIITCVIAPERPDFFLLEVYHCL